MSREGRPLRVVLVDDDQFSREGLRRMFEAEGAEVVSEAGTLAEAVEQLGSEQPDVVVLDPKVPPREPADSISEIVGAAPGVPVAVLSDSLAEHDVLIALAGGAASYLSKGAPAEELLIAIRQTAAGSTVLAAGAARGVRGSVAAPGRALRSAPRSELALSARESEVLGLIVDGADNGEIGRVLSISRHTVKQHVTNIFDKLGVRTRVEAAVMAVRENLL